MSYVQFDRSTRPLRWPPYTAGVYSASVSSPRDTRHSGVTSFEQHPSGSSSTATAAVCSPQPPAQISPRPGTAAGSSLSQVVKALCFLTSSCPVWGSSNEFSAVVSTFLTKWCHGAQASDGRGPRPACRGSWEDAFSPAGSSCPLPHPPELEFRRSAVHLSSFP